MPPPRPAAVAPQISETTASIRSLADTDPVVALAKLRINSKQAASAIPTDEPKRPVGKRPIDLGSIMRELIKREVFDQEFGIALRNITSISNRAIHGEDIRDVYARQIVNTGGELLELVWILQSVSMQGCIRLKKK